MALTYNKYYWLTPDSEKILRKDYLLPNESPQERIRGIAERGEFLLGEFGRRINFAEKFIGFMEDGIYSPSSPLWSNFGRKRGLPISCFGSYIPDTKEGIFTKLSEAGMMSAGGGGTSGYWGAVRGRGAPITDNGASTGTVPFMSMFDHMMGVVSQGSVRRGSYAAYLPVDHPDIEEFLTIRGTGHAIQEMSIGVCIPDSFMHRLKAGDMRARKIWGLILRKRFESGYPYLFFVDNANRQAPDVYKELGLTINNSNLCTEIALSNSEDESFVCNLASMNGTHYDKWKNTEAVRYLIYLMDAVNTEFIDKTEGMPYMEAARKFAINQRALGLGVLGWHSLLIDKMIPFDSLAAGALNEEMWKFIRSETDAATEILAKEFGEAPILEGRGRRNTTTIAVAPTVTSSAILGHASPGIEYYNSNYFVKNLAKGHYTFRSPHMNQLLTEKGKNNESIWRDILVNGGSIQHLDFFSDEEKDVYRTASEISQMEVINMALVRQKYIDQGQSLNLDLPPNLPDRDYNRLIFHFWENGGKSLYYHRSSNPSQELARKITTCRACDG